MAPGCGRSAVYYMCTNSYSCRPSNLPLIHSRKNSVFQVCRSVYRELKSKFMHTCMLYVCKGALGTFIEQALCSVHSCILGSIAIAWMRRRLCDTGTNTCCGTAVRFEGLCLDSPFICACSRFEVRVRDARILCIWIGGGTDTVECIGMYSTKLTG